jgi:hypothetical protein
MLHKTFRVAALAVALSAASCSSESALVTITGNVTLDGTPLPEGDILFTPADTQFGSEGAKIENGAYRAALHPGQSKVQIRATRPVPGKKGPMGEQLIEDYIPSKYNDQSTLTIDVSKSQNKHDFQLHSK